MHINHQHNPLSASKLEVYNQCPYKYYLQYILKVDSIHNSLIQSNEIGTLVHYVLEKIIIISITIKLKTLIP